MRGNPAVDHAIVDALEGRLTGVHDVYIVGGLCRGAFQRLARSLGEGLVAAERPDRRPVKPEAVVVLDTQWLDEAQALVKPGGTLTVAARNPRYGTRLVELLEGRALSGRSTDDLEHVYECLQVAGWAVEEAIPVTVPLALLPFDPTRVPKTVLAYLYARHPDIETYCFLVRARRQENPPRAAPPGPRCLPGDYPTMPWKSEAEWRQETQGGVDDAAAAMASGDELFRIKSSLAWRAIVTYRTARERLLPPPTRRGRVYAMATGVIRRFVVRGGRWR